MQRLTLLLFMLFVIVLHIVSGSEVFEGMEYAALGAKKVPKTKGKPSPKGKLQPSSYPSLSPSSFPSPAPQIQKAGQWFLSDGSNCLTECNKHNGKTCNAKFMKELQDESQFEAAYKSAGGKGCDAYYTGSGFTSEAWDPSIDVSTADGKSSCYTQDYLQSSTCEASITAYPGYISSRLCYCE